MDSLFDWRSRAGPVQRNILEAAAAAARDAGSRLFIAGGPVRDLALGIPFVDIDLVVEQNGQAVVSRLAETLEAEVQTFPRFLTWRIDSGDGSLIDITTARTELYAHPGALPVVAASTIGEDLLRRDFAANAIALDLATSEVIDPTGGSSDIGHRVMRVLHERSFHDDPTRMLRGIRIATRLGFHFDPATANLIREAVAQNALGSISRERVWREIFIAMRDSRPAETLIEMRRLGLLEPFLFTSAGHEDVLRLVEQNLSVTSKVDREVIYSGVLLGDAPRPGESLVGSGFSKARARKTASLMNESRLLVDRLARAASPLEQLRLSAHAGDEARIVAAAISDDAARTIQRFAGYTQVALGFRGDELGLPPGPHIASALEAAREAVFLEVIPASDARTFARSIGLKYLNGEIEDDSEP